MPLSPRKCCGKKVKFTPINMVINWIFSHFGFKLVPVKRGNQWINPPIMANTAPMDRT